MLSNAQVQRHYLDNPLRVPSFWNLIRKHFRVMLSEGRFVKLNRFSNRLNEKDLRFYCWKLAPRHVYFSVLNCLFPERVGKKYKARYCVPLNGEYVVDVDSYMVLFKHDHKPDPTFNVCLECVGMAKRLTLQLFEAIESYYSKIAIVFSGRMGFHVHILDFHYKDWVPYREKDPIWCHHASRFKFTKLLQKQTHVFDRTHFTVSADPMRVVTVPDTLNARASERRQADKFLNDIIELQKFAILLYCTNLASSGFTSIALKEILGEDGMKKAPSILADFFKPLLS